MLVIGVTGGIASGKGTAADILKEQGYSIVSLTDELKKEVEKKNLPLTRENFLNVGDELRKGINTAFLAEKTSDTIEKINSDTQNNKFVVDGLKNPGEILCLKEKYNMFLVGILTDLEKRKERLVKRASPLDQNANPETIRKQIERDLGIGQENYGNNIEACLKLSDIKIENNGTLDEFRKKLHDALFLFESKAQRGIIAKES